MKYVGLVCALFLIFVGGVSCTSMPTDGPSTQEIVTPNEAQNYVFIEVDEKAARILSSYSAGGLHSKFSTARTSRPSDRIGVGDVLAIRVLEAGKQGLFAQVPNGGSSANFPAIVVNTAGDISLPYVGVLNVAELTLPEVEAKIVAALVGRAIEPQASVSLVKTANNNVTVSGGVMRPGDYPLSLRGRNLAQVVSHAGGSKFPDFETRVTVIRQGVRAYARLDRVLLEPAQNIALQRDDLIVLSHEPEQYTVTGAVGRSGLFPFGSKSINVLEAVSKAGGLLDGRADPTGVFLFRYENKSTLERMGQKDLRGIPRVAGRIPTIYRINFQDVSSRFYAQAVTLRNDDALFVSNSQSVQLAKLLALFRSGVTTADAALTAGNN